MNGGMVMIVAFNDLGMHAKLRKLARNFSETNLME